MSVKQIAELSGVSVATVSRVLHKSDKVKSHTKKKVENAMDQLGLSANDLIRGVKTDSCVIGIVVPDLSNVFFAEVIAGMREIAENRNMSLFICDTHENDQTEIQYLRLLKETRVRGIIITPASDDDDCINNEYLNMLSSMNIPVVLLDRDVKYSNFPGVFIDNVRSAFEATRLLIESGHINIAIIAGPVNTKPGRERLQGYREAFAVKNLVVNEKYIFYGDFSLESGRLQTEHILKEHPEVTAIFTSNNMMTLGCLAALRNSKKEIPDDISLVSFDEIETLSMLGVHVTSVKRATHEMGRQAMKLLFNLINNKEKTVSRRITLMPEILCRNSEHKGPVKGNTEKGD